MSLINSPLFLEDLAPWNENPNSVWLASTIILNRNIENYNFPTKLPQERRRQLVALIGKEMGDFPGFDQPKLLKSEDCTPLDKEFLVEHCLTNEGFIQAGQGEAFIFDRKGESILTVNIEDHLHFHYIDIKGELEKGLNTLAALEAKIAKTLPYAFSPRFGFLTSHPFTCGTGLVLSLFLQISGLLHGGTWKAVKDSLIDESIEITGLLGKEDELVGDLVVARNQYTLGVNEESILSSLRAFATKLLAEESKARQKIQQSNSAEIKDKVARAYALLMYSYQIETVEALNEIALMKFGLEMGWIKGVTLTELNALFFSCRRAHLLRRQKDKILLEEVAHKRAELIHTTLKNVVLTI